ncbi:cytochrome c oxidase subunit 3 [Sphingomonas sp. ID0503]|uniref:cytochrome c oxidase subunit 3 n=1 Tax=Sphingomonas sp. ID0503 TaxID=3399691 RepID=UPI003AFAB585
MPGSEGIWTFLFIDMLVFLLIFLTFMSERLRLPLLYASSQRLLDGWLGLANTVILLTSSWIMFTAIQAWRAERLVAARRRLGIVLLLGGAFCGIKVAEYYHKIVSGVDIAGNSFMSFYFVMTGIHLLHVLFGLAFIASMSLRLRRRETAPAIGTMENVGLFWHFVDVLWVYIFALLYLVGLR